MASSQTSLLGREASIRETFGGASTNSGGTPWSSRAVQHSHWRISEPQLQGGITYVKRAADRRAGTCSRASGGSCRWRKKTPGRFEPLVWNPPNLAQTLANDQKLALEQILASRDFVTLFRGGAGTGKSYVLRNVQEAIAQRGNNTVVLAPQRQQVITYSVTVLKRAQTLAVFLQRQIMPPGAVVIVDEAGQIGGGRMLALLEQVTAS